MYHFPSIFRRANRAGHPWDGHRFNARLSYTEIERMLAAILSTIGIEGRDWCRQQKLPQMPAHLRGHEFDFCIPAARLMIEADGCYTHACPQCYPEAAPRVRDAAIDLAALGAGWTVLRFWEHDIRRNAGAVRARVLEALQAAGLI